MRRQLKEEIVIQMVQEKRRKLPRIGSKKLYKMLEGVLNRNGLKIGRDAFISILRDNGLFVQKKRHYVKTTNSNHRFRIYDNLIKQKEVTRKDEVYVSDITYIKCEDKFCYLALVTDVYSRKIVGYDFSESLSLEGSVRALKKAISGKQITDLIHHSDRGIQYCSQVYINILKENNIKISMAEKGNPYENAIAERLNGILKDEFLLSETFKTVQMARKAVEEAIKNYNELRPHMSIGYMTPNEKYAA
jgi:transposase InsO family protein